MSKHKIVTHFVFVFIFSICSALIGFVFIGSSPDKYSDLKSGINGVRVTD